MKNLFLAALTALALGFIAAPAIAHDMPGAMAGDLEFTAAFARAMPPAAPTGGGFVTITNHGDTDEMLTGATSPSAGMVELHQMVMENDIMKMGEVEGGLAIPAGETVTLAPGGYHLMFMQVTAPFAEGDTVTVTLHFEHQGDVDLMLPVAPIGAKEMPMAHMDH